MITVADFAPFVEIKAPNSPTANVHHAIREAIVGFMRMSRAAVDEVYINVPCGEREVIVVPKGCQHLVKIEHIFVDPSCRQNSRWNPDWDRLPDSDRTEGGWWIDDVGGPNATVWLAEGAPREQRLCVRYAWSIKRDDCEVPEWIYQDHADTIADGALTYLHLNPSDENASRPFAQLMGPVFMEGVHNARRRKEVQYRRRQVNVANAGFFRG
jgi:hypothetical protein